MTRLRGLHEGLLEGRLTRQEFIKSAARLGLASSALVALLEKVPDSTL